MKHTILITGGAGYIGSHTAYLLAQQGHEIIILDTLVHKQWFNHSWATVIKEDFGNETILETVFSTYKIDAVMHFAAFIEVGESVKDPQRFYHNNVVKTIKLLNAMLKYNIKKFIFSSSCAVFGEPISIPISESHPRAPISPYGKNKLAIEFALEDYAIAYNLNYVTLRYFNASGGLPEAMLGEQHNPETHIIPLMLRAIQHQTPFKIFGTDYNTPDGSCIRDYIHVRDIAIAHILALDYLSATKISDSFNLGSGRGFSVKEMIKKAEELCGQKMIIRTEPRRPGDPAILLGDPTKAQKVLGWKPVHSDLDTILRSAFEWENTKALIHDGEIVSQVQLH